MVMPAAVPVGEAFQALVVEQPAEAVPEERAGERADVPARITRTMFASPFAAM